MRSQFVAFLLVAAMLFLAIPPTSEAQVLDSVTYLMGGIPQGKVVAGIVHNITIALTAPVTNLTLQAYLDGGFSQSNYTTNYSWTYQAGTWTDNLYDYYIKPESNVFGNSYCFYVSLDTGARAGTWRWVVTGDGAELYNEPRVVETPVAGISMSSPTFYPRIFPYGTGTYNSFNAADPANSTSLWTRNIGNVPLTLTISYDKLNSLFQTSNGTGTFLPGEERTHYVSFQAQSWSPRKFTVKGLIHGEPQLVMTPNTISCIVAPQTTYDVVVTVARQGYEVYQMDNVVVQYKKYYPSKFKDSLTLDMYFSGNTSINLNGDMDRLTLNSLDFQGVQYDGPLQLDLVDTAERYVQANITCSVSPGENQASILAYANFNITLVDQSDEGRFTSTVVVASVPESLEPPPPLTPNMIVIIVILAIFGVIGVVMLMARRKAEIERRKELEERIRQKKERARRRR